MLFACGGIESGEGAPVEADDGLQSSTQAINGNFSFVNCTTEEEAKMASAMYIARLWLLWTPTLENCMKNSFLSMSREENYPQTEDSVEQIMHRMRENMPTTIECSAAINNADASYHPSYERVRFGKTYIASHTTLFLAGVLLHEVSHNKGYDHPRGSVWAYVEYKYTVPDQLATCLSEIFSQPTIYDNNVDVKRSDLRGEVELSMAGAGGGWPYEMECANGSHVKSVYLGTGNFDGYDVVKKITAFCYKPDGTYASQATVGGSPSSYLYKSCPSGYRATGIYGGAGLYIDSLGLLCTPISTLKAGSSYNMVQSGSAGGSGGTTYRRECPAGMAISHIFGRSGAAIDQVRVVCQNVNEKRGTVSKSGVYGTATGYVTHRRCSGFGAMVGLYGQERLLTNINRLGGRCLETRQAGPLLSRYPEVTPDTNHVIPANGEDLNAGGTAVTLDCPTGQAMVGIRVSSTSDQVSAVGARCAGTNAWQNNTYVLPTNTALAGGLSSTKLQTFTCPKGKFVVGLDTWFADNTSGDPVIKGVRAVCRTLVSPLVLIKKPFIAKKL